MGRYNKYTDSVFNRLKGDYDKFIQMGTEFDSSQELLKLERQYKHGVEQLRLPIETISILEEIIMQMRTVENIRDTRLGTQQDLIFIRCPFYRTDTEGKDIKAYVGTTHVYGTDLDSLYEDDDFIFKAEKKLKDKMYEIIERNIKEYEKYLEAIR